MALLVKPLMSSDLTSVLTNGEHDGYRRVACAWKAENDDSKSVSFVDISQRLACLHTTSLYIRLAFQLMPTIFTTTEILISSNLNLP